MEKTTKIILISLGSLVLIGGGYLIFRHYRKKGKKSDEDILKNRLGEMRSSTTFTKTTPNTKSSFLGTSNVTGTPNLATIHYLKLDDKLKKFYNVLGMLGVNNGRVVYVADGSFIPSEPNKSPEIDVQKAVWRKLYNDYISVLAGFNRDETNIDTKNYGNKMLDLFKTNRLDYLFPPLTATGQITDFNPKAPWYQKVEKENVKLKTDYWKN